MASTAPADIPKGVQSDTITGDDPNGVGETEVLSPGSQKLHRKLRGREVQLFAVGGAIGTSLFVQMGSALPKGGPAGLFLGFIAYGTIVLAVNECFAEMVCYMPIPSPFVRLAGRWVDDALSFAMGWNFFLAMALNIPYEIVAINVLLTYWTDKVPAAAVVVVVMAIYGILNVLTVRYFGIAEFYLSFFKIFLMLGLILYTFVTMVGGNPHRDAIGFRYWNDPGAFVSHLVPGDTGRFLGVLSCMIQGAFTMVGPEFISMAAGESERPRRVMRKAFASFGWRLMFFFCLGALCVGIVIPYNDPTLAAMLDGTKQGSGTGAASPYVISMNHFGIAVLPDIVNALIMTSVLSAGNNVVFSASRTLYGMSLEKKAPKWVSKTNRAGLPYNAVAIAMAFSLLGFLQVNNSSATVLDWLVSCIAGSYLLNYFGTCITYLHFHASLHRQGISRESLPYRSRFQPYTAWYALCGTGVMVLVLGYNVFLSGGWDLESFFLNYVIIGFYALAFVFWKIFRRTRYVGIGKADLQLAGIKREIDEYEEVEYARRRGKPVALLDRLFE
ncbi:amino acid permease/ SLC12A domain-containing protein [Aspergillus tamarii]|uniref:Amino acid permease/ SLC12A domain-containing protein n=1 Tax=Aspergillus tamarii TaxID=41984 RepID=A0A5N6VBR5_ASPTM|nr:amino acid permease/ SLC12A domain-containing protein [Aspergillus tamarii]